MIKPHWKWKTSIYGCLLLAVVVPGGRARKNETEAASAPVLTGVPQIDYVHDPNLPRELKGYSLVDYPFYHGLPKDLETSNFTCEDRKDGFYASIPHKCQVYHNCLFGIRYDFLCANYTAFDQKNFICHFVSEVDCENSERHYSRNDNLYVDPTTTTTAPPPRAPQVVYVNRPQRRRPAQQPLYYDYYDSDDDVHEFRPPKRPQQPPLIRPNQGGGFFSAFNQLKSRIQLDEAHQGGQGQLQEETLAADVPPRRGAQQGQKRRKRPKPRFKRPKTTTTTTTTTTAPEYDSYDYYDYEYDYDYPESSTTTTTTTPRPRKPVRRKNGNRRRPGGHPRPQEEAGRIQDPSQDAKFNRLTITRNPLRTENRIPEQDTAEDSAPLQARRSEGRRRPQFPLRGHNQRSQPGEFPFEHESLGEVTPIVNRSPPPQTPFAEPLIQEEAPLAEGIILNDEGQPDPSQGPQFGSDQLFEPQVIREPGLGSEDTPRGSVASRQHQRRVVSQRRRRPPASDYL